MTNGLAIMVDGLVAFLLILTIGYCMMLNRRLKLLKADEQSLRATISELVTATEIAERAIGGLKVTVHECDMGLGERLRKAERMSIEMDRAIVSGKDLLSRLSQIVSAARRPDDHVAPAAPVNDIRHDAAATGAASRSNESKLDGKSGSKSATRITAKSEVKTDAKSVAAAAEAFAERLRAKVHGLAA